MRTRTAISWLLASLFAASSGCLSMDRSGAFSSLDRRDKGIAAQPTFATEELPQFRPPDGVAGKSSRDAANSPASFQTSPPKRSFDATTMALIESELRDSDPSDRKEWMEYLSSVEPEVVPHLLQARRLELKQRHGTDDAPAPTAFASSNAPVSAPEPKADDSITGKSPWDQPSGDSNSTIARADSDSGDDDGAVVNVSHSEQTKKESDTARPADPPWIQGEQTNPSESDGELRRTVSAHRDGPAPLAGEELSGEPSEDPLTERFSQIVQQRRETSSEAVPAAQDVELFSGEADEDPFEELDPSRMRTATKFSEDELLRLISLLEAETAQLEPGSTEPERARYIRSHVQLRLLYWMTGQPDRAMQAIPGLESAEQTYWTNTIWALSDYFDTQGTPDRAARMTQVLDRLVEATGSVEAQARLQLLNATFCRKIDGFGRVTTFSKDEFRPGQPVLVYAELARFGSELTEDGQYRTRIGSVIEIFRKGESKAVHRIEMDPTIDLCATRRRDYFHSYWIDLPPELQAGPHELRLRVVDELTGQHAATTLPFRIAE
ncbi:hypothetical protein Mal4_24110 [Maioricimonas rarisocia]|uniref:Uncharacterized protein n=1 Tax=Maioricimonas rarisocia TaxID=2528026 RepID=A0A517Z6H3_9PLAN|nr:hypothetical protein [Maioricimonas rarisocia]QDU38090.1 hypothetical protein Mal4_24110 [Maioricimonas rarisocia]